MVGSPPVPPVDPAIEQMAAKAARLRRFGKMVSDLTEVELRAAIWKGASSEIDAYNARLTPILNDLEALVRELENAGFELTITRTGEPGMADYDGVIDLPAVE